MRYGPRRQRAIVLAVTVAFVLSAAPMPAAAWTPLPVPNDPLVFQPGTQPGDSGSASGPDRCDNCHGAYNAAVEPAGNWRGSMMAQAQRDPLYYACLTVANQDSIYALGNPNAADICIRCHSPAGWLEGRSDPTNASLLKGVDMEGVQCDYCHRDYDALAARGQLTASNGSPDVPAEAPGSVGEQMAAQTQQLDYAELSKLMLFGRTQTFLATGSFFPRYFGPFPAYQEVGAGQHFLDPNNVMRGPFTDAVARHTFAYSRFHKSKEFCHTCHDVSNPVLANFGDPGQSASSRFAAASYFHVERTSSEYLTGEIGRAASPVPVNIPGVAGANKCQDCHMRDVTGFGCAKSDAPLRTDLPLHDLTGGNSWISGILATADSNYVGYDPYNYAILSGAKYPGAMIDLTGITTWGTKLEAGSERAIQQIKYGSTMTTVTDTASELTVRIRNNSAHKLISGYPEGRRLFLNVKWYDAAGAEITAAEINKYEPLVTTKDAAGNDVYVSGGDIRDPSEELIFEAEMHSDLTGEPTSTFHFALATKRWKDNRIPPRGFDTAKMAERIVEPVWNGESRPDLFTAAEYAGGYKDVTLTKPAGAVYYQATLYYQTTSKSYVEFLRNEINGTAGKTTLVGTGAGGDPAYLAQADPFFANLKGWGEAMWDLWLHNGGSAPIVMTRIGKMYTPPVTVDPPMNLTATGLRRSASLSWMAPSTGADAYRVYALAGGKWNLVAQVTTTTYSHLKLSSGSTMTYRVTALRTVGGVTYESGPSNEASCLIR